MRLENLLTFLLFALLIQPLVINAQVDYKVEKLTVGKHASIDLGSLEPGYDLAFEFLEKPYPGGEGYKEFLRQQKARSAELYPLKDTEGLAPRGSDDTPVVHASFLGNNSTTGRPLDNHLAVSNDNQVVSVINTHMAIMRPNGTFIKGIGFHTLFLQLDLDDFIYDPRILYDPAEDRWILAMMTGRSCNASQFVFGFSQSNDAAGMWNFYVFEGCPFDNNTFADFPMMAITQNEFFFTYNAVDEDLSWQEGFVETIILQINKHDGYAGIDLRSMMWSDIDYQGKPLRNVCPVEAATEELYRNCYFLSNRNFAIQNDSFFIMEITGSMDDPELELKIDHIITDVPYGLPPDARMIEGALATNDARVLDAIYYQGWIQFVGNTIHIDNGNSTVYHGYIEDVEGSRQMHGYVLELIDDHLMDLGYPAIAFAGLSPFDRDVIIVASHSSHLRPPGHSALYVDNSEVHSAWVNLKEGENYIEMIPNSDLERWGDYSGNQRKYDQPGTVWVSSSFGQQTRVNNTWITELSAPGVQSATADDPKDITNVVAYPNPTRDRVSIRFEIPESKQISISVYNINGTLVERLVDGRVKRRGDAILHFSTSPLSPGTYVIEGASEGKRLFSEIVVVN